MNLADFLFLPLVLSSEKGLYQSEKKRDKEGKGEQQQQMRKPLSDFEMITKLN